ncbi:MAG: DUF6273 domain-containing protein [Clostridia bacterium]|nr:DUF6273 domain-containing protein [Clostridia bacterium]
MNKKIKKALAVILCAIIAVSISACDSRGSYNNVYDDETSSSELSSSVNKYDNNSSDISSYSESDTNNSYDFSSVNVGDFVYFGTYEQDNDLSNGKEDVEWLVLAKENNKMLVISRYALDCQQYDYGYNDVTWETCSLRKWLNGTFINNAFSSDEQELIQSTEVAAEKNPLYSTPSGNNTTDNVFLLSITEVNKYFSSDEERQCTPTDYAVSQGAWKYDSLGGKVLTYWWLRSPGYDSLLSAVVGVGGNVSDYGSFVLSNDHAVRPALWINTES